jgi:glycosyltransferase involved in cell wall biosynthesis
MGPLPTLLFFNDFPPSNENGGTVLIRRLLNGYPHEKLVAVTRSQYGKDRVADTAWCRRHVVLPSIREKGRWGLSRLKGVMNWLLIPVIAFRGARVAREEAASAILSVAIGTYFLAAALTSAWTKVPLILIVHDDWVPVVAGVFHAPQWIFRYLTKLALRRASHVFVISDGMQQMVKALYGIDSEIQMPATEPWDLDPVHEDKPTGQIRVLYMGNGVSAQDSLELLIQLIREKTLTRYGLENVELHLCMPRKTEPEPTIRNHGWVTESEARKHVAASDILFLPYGFTAEDKAVTLSSFPAKAADYLASGKAILVIGPEDSTIVRYAEKFRCAAVVTELNKEALAEAIHRLAVGGEYSRELVSNARKAFEANHNIRRHQERFQEVVRRVVAGHRNGVVTQASRASS